MNSEIALSPREQVMRDSMTLGGNRGVDRICSSTGETRPVMRSVRPHQPCHGCCSGPGDMKLEFDRDVFGTRNDQAHAGSGQVPYGALDPRHAFRISDPPIQYGGEALVRSTFRQSKAHSRASRVRGRPVIATLAGARLSSRRFSVPDVAISLWGDHTLSHASSSGPSMITCGHRREQRSIRPSTR